MIQNVQWHVHANMYTHMYVRMCMWIYIRVHAYELNMETAQHEGMKWQIIMYRHTCKCGCADNVH
jgi:hypothetical protein